MLPTIASVRLLELGIARPEHPIATAIFCHGFPGTNLNMPLANALGARGVRTVLFRYTGVDEAGPWTFDRSALDAATVLRDARSAGPAPIIALGYSMGALHVTRAIARDGTLADLLVLLGPVLSLATFRAQLAASGSSVERFMSEGRALLDANATDRIAQYERLERADQPSDLLRTFAIPTMLVLGTADSVVSAADVPAAVANMPDAAALLVNDDHEYARTADRIADAVVSWARSKATRPT